MNGLVRDCSRYLEHVICELRTTEEEFITVKQGYFIIKCSIVFITIIELTEKASKKDQSFKNYKQKKSCLLKTKYKKDSSIHEHLGDCYDRDIQVYCFII